MKSNSIVGPVHPLLVTEGVGLRVAVSHYPGSQDERKAMKGEGYFIQ